jgi:hypothetical protein
MPADTFSEMILGFGVILGILLIYVLTLILRTQNARKPLRNLNKD